ncbi:TRI25 ligase, partial [Polypterus senegalus]
MAKAQLFVSKDEFTCSFCLDTLTDPVTILCGHSFCLKCLTDYWDQSQVYRCPKCRHTFTTRPELNRNTLLYEVIKKLKKTALSPPPSQNYAGPGDVECDFCTGKKFRVVKSCITCPASYCQTHLQLHFEGVAWKGHKLVDSDRNLKEKLCVKHQKCLEIFCKTDETCICVMCVVTGHKNHEIVELEKEREEKEKQLGATLSDIKRRLEEREKTLKQTRRAMEEMKISVEREMRENKKSFTALMRCIEEAYRKLTERIREQEKREMEKTEGVMEQLEKEIEELKTREAELKGLSETKDHLHFLQVMPENGSSESNDSSGDSSDSNDGDRKVVDTDSEREYPVGRKGRKRPSSENLRLLKEMSDNLEYSIKPPKISTPPRSPEIVQSPFPVTHPIDNFDLIDNALRVLNSDEIEHYNNNNNIYFYSTFSYKQ